MRRVLSSLYGVFPKSVNCSLVVVKFTAKLVSDWGLGEELPSRILVR